MGFPRRLLVRPRTHRRLSQKKASFWEGLRGGSYILFSFEADLLRRVTLLGAKGRRPWRPSHSGLLVRQESHRRLAEGYFHSSGNTGRDWPVMPKIRKWTRGKMKNGKHPGVALLPHRDQIPGRSR